MNRLTALALVLAVSASLAGSMTESFSYSAAAVRLEPDRGYTRVGYAGAPRAEPLGAPDLPVVPYYLAIPPTAEVTGLEIVAIEEEPLASGHDVLPVQHAVPWMANPPQQPFVEPDPEHYSVDRVYPKEAARYVRSASKSGYRLASIEVYPVRCNPVRRTLSLVKRVTVRLKYAEGRRHVPRYTETQIALHGDQVRRLVLNPEDITRFAPPKRTHSYGSLLLPAGEYEHLIITRAQWADSLAGLRNWRTRQGWRSKIMPLESICAVYPGRDTAEKMRNFIKDADTTWGTIFVFIARDDYPAKQYRRAYGHVSSYIDTFPSDLYFSDLDGDWDANGNNLFGEIADNVDGLADVHVGMITLNGLTELANYLDKLFRYEFNPDTTENWITKSLLPNGVSFSNEYNDSIANASPTPPWFDLKMYTSGGMVSPSPSRFCDSLNSGYSITSVIAHGEPNSFTLGGSVTSSMMLGLTNTDRLNVLTAVCCHTGEFEAGTTNGDCIAENMAFHAPAGFVGVMMNTRYGWVDIAELLNYSICYGILGFRTPRRVTQGEALSYGKDYWNAFLEDSAKWRWEVFERTLFGAPAVPVWTGAPFVASVTKPGAINVGSGIPVNITVTDGSDAPVESALVCLIKGEETFGRDWTDASGQVTLLMSPLTPGQLHLTVTCANNLPYLDSIAVVAAGKFVCYLRHEIKDSVVGNNDGIINPGETVRIPMWVKNYGDSTAQDVIAQLITHTSGITVTDPNGSFGNIPGHDSAYDAQGFELQVANGLPNGYAIPCSLVCEEDFDDQWVSFVTFRVGAPVLVFVDKEIKDEGSAQPNGRLDPGETADLEATIRNSGLGHAHNVYAVLRSTDPRLTVPDSHAVYGLVMADSMKTNITDHFTVSASAAIPPETAIPCTLTLYADNGYQSQAGFTIVVGEVRQIDPIPDGPREPALYWAYDDGDSGYIQAPEFQWVEVSGTGTHLSLDDDQTVQVNLGAFGPFVFYGQSYSQLSVCSNGFVAPGATTYEAWTNYELPYSSAPPMLALFWDDLYPETGGGVWYYHDAANHRFVVEWDSVHYYSPRGSWDKFQVVIYDTSLAAPDGNSEFTYQYLTANNYGSGTVGEQDQTKTIAIQTLYNGSYHRGALPLAAGRAVKFTTDAPQVGIGGPVAPLGLASRRLVVAPNPFARSALIHWHLTQNAEAELKVFDATGRVVRTLVSGPVRAGTHTTAWNGNDDSGRKLSHGIYFVRLSTPDATTKVKTVLTR